MRTIKTYVDKAEDGDTIEIEFMDDKMGCLEEALEATNIIMEATKKNITIKLKTTAVFGEEAEIHKTYQELTFIPYNEIIKKIESESELDKSLPYLNYLNIDSVIEQIGTNKIQCAELDNVIELYKNFKIKPDSINLSLISDVASSDHKAFMLLSPTERFSMLKEKLKDPTLVQTDLKFICEYFSKNFPHKTYAEFSKTKGFYPHANFFDFYTSLGKENKKTFLQNLLQIVESDTDLKKNDFIQFLIFEADINDIKQLPKDKQETAVKLLLNSENIKSDTSSSISHKLFKHLNFDENLYQKLDETEKNNLFRMIREGPLNRLLSKTKEEIQNTISEYNDMYRFINVHFPEIAIGLDQDFVANLALKFKNISSSNENKELTTLKQSILSLGEFLEEVSKIKSKSPTFNDLKTSPIDKIFFENYVKCMEESYNKTNTNITGFSNVLYFLHKNYSKIKPFLTKEQKDRCEYIKNDLDTKSVYTNSDSSTTTILRFKSLLSQFKKEKAVELPKEVQLPEQESNSWENK